MALQVRTIAKNLTVSTETVCKLFEETGSVSPGKPDRSNTRSLSKYAELYVVGLLIENPGLYLGVMCHNYDQQCCGY